MDVETTIAQGLHVTDDSAGYDAACKRVLSEKAILARIMKSCLEEYKDCDVGDIAEKYIEGQPQVSAVPVLPDEDSTVINGMDTEDKSVYEGTVTYDIRFRAIVPGSDERIALIINVEAQNDFYPGYPLIKRGIYYCCRMISSQHGREFTGSHYEKIKKVYSIWICMNPPKSRENTITRYRLVEEHLVGGATEPVRNYDLLSIIMLCLGGPDGENYDGVLRMLDVLLSNETSAAEKRKILRDDYDIQMTKAMEKEVSDMCNLSKGVMEKGRAEGIVENTLVSIRNLMETLSLTIEQAMAALKVPESERQKYIDLLGKQ
ncbi:MAG: hypothetical protein K2O18_01280 [Oscillospiraceae bacterium]|nr:hypothetical protein [Oscillospiraceae bacterium]